MWIKTTNGHFINSDHVAQVSFQRTGDNSQSTMLVKYPNGETESVTISNFEHENLKEELFYDRTFLPSPPGYFLLSYYERNEKSGEEKVTHWPVLGWFLDPDSGSHTVVTARLNCRFNDFEYNNAILCPNGCVVRPGECCYPDEAAWLNEMRKQKLEKAA